MFLEEKEAEKLKKEGGLWGKLKEQNPISKA